jgi:Na+-driven multidrug efflux pump
MDRKKWIQAVIAIVIAFGIAIIVNQIVLKLFGQKSADRAEHSLVGIVFLMAYGYIFQDKKNFHKGLASFFLIALIPCYLGTVFPDLDIKFLGIGGHRNPLFHSCLSYFILFFIVSGKNNFLRILVIGYGVGLGSHFWWDIIYYGDVRWIPGGTLDRAWLFINGLLSFIPPRAETISAGNA